MNNEVTIRPIKEGDQKRIRGWINQPEVRDNLVISGPINKKDQIAWFENLIKDVTKKVFAIEHQGRHVGNISLFNIDKRHDRAQLSIFIGEPEFRNKGLGTKALLALFELAFRKLSLVKIILEVLVDNSQAIASYKKAGMKPEGLLRSHVFLHGKRRDMIVMSILAEEFLKERRHDRKKR